MKKNIGYLTIGCDFQIRSFRDFSNFMDDMIYVHDIKSYNLSHYKCIIVPDGISYNSLLPHKEKLNNYILNGGFLIVFDYMERLVEDLITVVKIKSQLIPTKDWLWWTKPEKYIEIYQPKPKHSICDFIPIEHMSWHWRKIFEFDNQAQSALNLDDDRGSILLDYKNLKGNGRLMITSVDPFSHNGQRFMPATTHFLKGFYLWLNKELGVDNSDKRYTLTYIEGSEYAKDNENTRLIKIFKDTRFDLKFHLLYELNEDTFNKSDILYLPSCYDQFFLKKKAHYFLEFLEKGNDLILCTQSAIQWLPFLKNFKPIPPRPFSNIKVRIRQDPFGFFKNMGENFDIWEGIFGMYSLGYSEMPEGAIWLTDIGDTNDPKPADWFWKYPTIDNKGGGVFVHNGFSICRHPHHGEFKECLIRDVCEGLIKHRNSYQYFWNDHYIS